MRSASHGLALQLEGRPDLKFDFWRKEFRDEVLARILSACKLDHGDTILESPLNASPKSTPLTSPTQSLSPSLPERPADILAPPRDLLLHSRVFSDSTIANMPFVANKPWMATIKLAPRTFTCLTIGSRGDVQPYIALGLRLKRDGHKVVIVTHGTLIRPSGDALISDEFKHWIEGYGIEHRQAGGDPTALMKLSAEHKVQSSLG